MSRFIKILFIMTVFTVAISSISFADIKDVDNWTRYKAISDPGVDSVSKAATWTQITVTDYSSGQLQTPIVIGSGESIWIGIKNHALPKIKFLRMHLVGTNIDALGITDVYGVVYGAPNQETPGSNMSTIFQNATSFQADYVFNPQPDQEVFKITATGKSITINRLFVTTHCTVPSLTQYGLALLVLMLIATAVVIYRRHRRVTA